MVSSSSGIEVRTLQETEFSRWRAFVDSAPAGSIYSYPEYLDILCRIVGGSFRVLSAWKGDEIHGGIALYERQGLGGTVLSGRLLLYYNGFVLRTFGGAYPSKNTAREITILGALEEALSREPYAHTQIRNRHPIRDLRPFLQNGWTAQPSYSYVVPLDDPAETFSRIEQNQRRLIRKCEDSGATVVVDEDFQAFFRMHLGTHLRKGAPLYLPEEAFRRYFEGLSAQNLCRLYHVRTVDGRTVGSQLVLLGGHPITHTVTAGADPEFLRQGTTPFLRWKVCEGLAAEGYLGNDLTDAALNDVTRFKSQLGGELVTNLVLHYPDSPRYRLTRLASRLYRRGRSSVGKVRRLGRRAT